MDGAIPVGVEHCFAWRGGQADHVLTTHVGDEGENGKRSTAIVVENSCRIMLRISSELNG